MVAIETEIEGISLLDIHPVELDFCDHDFSYDASIESVANTLQDREDICCDCLETNSVLSNIFEDDERQTKSFGDQHTHVDPASHLWKANFSLEEPRKNTEGQRYISDDECDISIGTFGNDNDACICRFVFPDQKPVCRDQNPSLKLLDTSLIQGFSSGITPSFNDEYFDTLLDKESPLGHPVNVEKQEKEGLCPKITASRKFMDTESQDRFRVYQRDQWEKRYEELKQVFRETGLSAVHYKDVSKKGLARWIKRQRAQYKLRSELKPSSMTDERIQALEDINFVWDSYSAAWEEHIHELKAFKAKFNHCNVTSTNYRPARRNLLSWIKSQRRQYRQMKEGKKSTLTPRRISQLESLGFQFELYKK